MTLVVTKSTEMCANCARHCHTNNGQPPNTGDDGAVTAESKC